MFFVLNIGTKIRIDFFERIKNGEDHLGNYVGPYHFMIAATAKKNKDVMYIGESLGIPNIHASGGNPAMWWENQEQAYAAGKKVLFFQSENKQKSLKSRCICNLNILQ